MTLTTLKKITIYINEYPGTKKRLEEIMEGEEQDGESVEKMDGKGTENEDTCTSMEGEEQDGECRENGWKGYRK